MITLICPVKRRPELSREQFHDHWCDVHAKLLKDTPTLARHLISYTQYPSAASEYKEAEPTWDGVAIARYQSMEAMHTLFAEPEYQRVLQPDENYLTLPKDIRWVLCDSPHEVIVE